MFLITALLALEVGNCTVPDSFQPPDSGTVFETRIANFTAYEQIIRSQDHGAVTSRWYVAPEADAPIAQRMGYDRIRRSYFGLVLLGMDTTSRLGLDPAELAQGIAGLSPGEEVAFRAPYSTITGGRRHTDVVTVTVKFDGCATAATPAGVFEVLDFEIRRPIHQGTNGGGNTQEQVTSYSYAPEIGWPVRVRDDTGELELVEIHRAE